MVPFEEVKIWLIRLPEPAADPVTFVAESTVQLKVVPLTAFGLVIAILEEVPEQIAASVAEAVGTGRTVTT